MGLCLSQRWRFGRWGTATEAIIHKGRHESRIDVSCHIFLRWLAQDARQRLALSFWLDDVIFFLLARVCCSSEQLEELDQRSEIRQWEVSFGVAKGHHRHSHCKVLGGPVVVQYDLHHSQELVWRVLFVACAYQHHHICVSPWGTGGRIVLKLELVLCTTSCKRTHEGALNDCIQPSTFWQSHVSQTRAIKAQFVKFFRAYSTRTSVFDGYAQLCTMVSDCVPVSFSCYLWARMILLRITIRWSQLVGHLCPVLFRIVQKRSLP